MQTLIEFLKKTDIFLEKKGIKSSRLEAEKIFAKALNMDRIMLYANYDKILTDEQIKSIKFELSDNKKEKENNIKNNIESSVIYLKKHNVKEASLITELIFSNVLKIDRMLIFMQYNKNLSKIQKEKIREDLKKIAIEKLPYQYLINNQNFYGRDFFVDKRVLIPRYDTECLVEKVLGLMSDESLVLDIGTGSGAIAITLALEKPNSKILATDISEKALQIASKNKKILEANNVKLLQSDLFDNIHFKKFDIIVSNPPYITNDEIDKMGLDTYIHEPHLALFASVDGLYFYYEISKKAKHYLKDGGILAFEIGYNQKESVIKILKELNYEDITAYKDINGNDRVVICKKPREGNNGY